MLQTLSARLEDLSARVNRLVEVALWILVAATVAVTFAQVVFRYGLNSSLSWSEEFARYAFVWMIFLGTSVAARRGQHIAVGALISVFPAPVRRSIAIGIALISIAFFALFAYVGWLLVENARYQYSTALDVSIAYVYAAAPLGATLTLLHLLNGCLQTSLSTSVREF